MGRRHIKWLALIAFVVLNISVFLARRDQKPKDLPKAIDREVTLQFKTAENPIQARIDGMISQLKTESVEQSLAALPSCELYRWPGSIDSEIVLFNLPLKREIGSYSVKRILSNRRFRKTLQELRLSSREKQVAKLLAALHSAGKLYDQHYKDYQAENAAFFHNDAPPPSSSPLIQVSDNLDGSPTVFGSRLSVLALILMAGNLQLEECNEAIKSIVEQAVAQRDEILSMNEYRIIYTYMLLKRVSLYNRQILAAALIGTSAEGGPGTVPCDMGAAEWTTARLTAFDAPATVFDLHYKHGAIKIAEDSKTVKVEYLTSLSDEEFDRIVAHLK